MHPPTRAPQGCPGRLSGVSGPAGSLGPPREVSGPPTLCARRTGCPGPRLSGPPALWARRFPRPAPARPGPAPPAPPRGAAAAPAHIGPLRRTGRAAAAAPGMAQGSTSLWQQQRGTAPWTSCSAPQVTGAEGSEERARSPPPCRGLAGAAEDEARVGAASSPALSPAFPPRRVCPRYPPLSLRPPARGEPAGLGWPGGTCGLPDGPRARFPRAGSAEPQGRGKGRRAPLLASGRAQASPRPLWPRRARGGATKRAGGSAVSLRCCSNLLQDAVRLCQGQTPRVSAGDAFGPGAAATTTFLAG